MKLEVLDQPLAPTPGKLLVTSVFIADGDLEATDGRLDSYIDGLVDHMRQLLWGNLKANGK